MSDTKIPWADKSWNIVTGCGPDLQCYAHCYARRMAPRLAGRFGYDKDNPFAPTFHTDRLRDPERWKPGTRVFPCSMGDLFYDSVPEDWQEQVFSEMEWCDKLIFLVLTKRPKRMAQFIAGRPIGDHIWLGISAENQTAYSERWREMFTLCDCNRFVSLEPLLAPISITGCLMALPDWVIVGPETGQGARPCKEEWIQKIADECKVSSIPFFDKRVDYIRREFPDEETR